MDITRKGSLMQMLRWLLIGCLLFATLPTLAADSDSVAADDLSGIPPELVAEAQAAN